MAIYLRVFRCILAIHKCIAPVKPDGALFYWIKQNIAWETCQNLWTNKPFNFPLNNDITDIKMPSLTLINTNTSCLNFHPFLSCWRVMEARWRMFHHSGVTPCPPGLGSSLSVLISLSIETLETHFTLYSVDDIQYSYTGSVIIPVANNLYTHRLEQ